VLADDNPQRAWDILEVVGHHHSIDEKLSEDSYGAPRHGRGGFSDRSDSDCSLDIERVLIKCDRTSVPMKIACNAVTRIHCP
jgi:hypothetical protein